MPISGISWTHCSNIQEVTGLTIQITRIAWMHCSNIQDILRTNYSNIQNITDVQIKYPRSHRINYTQISKMLWTHCTNIQDALGQTIQISWISWTHCYNIQDATGQTIQISRISWKHCSNIQDVKRLYAPKLCSTLRKSVENTRILSVYTERIRVWSADFPSVQFGCMSSLG